MKDRFEKILADMDNNTLGLDDEFKFKCRGCGKCCKNRDDIILTTRDLYNIAKDLGRTMKEIVDRYCEVYLGDSSRVPVVRLKPVGPQKACPLQYDKRCVVHKAKPVVCAMYPLGRAYVGANDKAGITDEDKIAPRYFLQSTSCGSPDRTQTVRNWLEKFGIPVKDEFYPLWTRTLVTLSEFFHWAEDNSAPELVLESIWNFVFFSLYLEYDINAELMPQFCDHSKKLTGSILTMKADMEKEFARLAIAKFSEGTSDGVPLGGLPDGA